MVEFFLHHSGPISLSENLRYSLDSNHYWLMWVFASLSLANGLHCLTDYGGMLSEWSVNWTEVRRFNYQ